MSKSIDPSKNWSAKEFVDQYDEFIDDDNLKQAISYLDRVLSGSLPEHLRILLLCMKSTTHYWLDEDEEAIECCRSAIKVDPNSLAAWSELGFIYFEQGNFQTALSCFEKELKIAKDHTSALKEPIYPTGLLCALINIAKAKYYLQDVEGAINALNEATEICPNDLMLAEAKASLGF